MVHFYNIIYKYDLNDNFSSEVRIEDYKADVVYEGNEKIIIENKAIISTNKNASFPTVYSQRAIDQLKKLYILLEKGNKIHYNFISLSPYIKTIKINEEQEDYYKQFIKCAYFGDIRTLIPELSGQHIGIIRTPCRANKLNATLKVYKALRGANNEEARHVKSKRNT